MKQTISFLIVLAVLSLTAFAGGPTVPVATADSSAAFLIAGHSVPRAGIGNWPIFSGQSVTALDKSVLISLKDGSRVLLDRQSELTLLRTNDKISVKVTKGSVSYRMANQGSMTFDVVDKAITNVLPASGAVAAQVGLTADTVGYFALTNRAATPAGSMPIVLNFTNLPSGVETVPGPPPESSYRGSN